MKLRLYTDLWPGMDPQRYAVIATTQPGPKSDGTKRIAFDVTIPDSLIYAIDGHAAEVSTPVVLPVVLP
jgi:hypothetical protein